MRHLELLWQSLWSALECSVWCHSQHYGRMAKKTEKFSFEAMLRRHEIVKLLSNNLVKAQFWSPSFNKVSVFGHSDLYEPQLFDTREKDTPEIAFLILGKKVWRYGLSLEEKPRVETQGEVSERHLRCQH